MILKIWSKLSSIPLGKKLFSLFIRFYVPYTGSVRPEVVELSRGKAVVRIKDRRRVRNHLKSVHAIALMNVGEFSTGLALIATLPENFRCILTHIEMDYFKKARGILTSTCLLSTTQFEDKQKVTLESKVTNEQNEIVCAAKTVWQVGEAKR